MIERPILFVRHAKAEDEHPAGDEARGLTAEGREEFRAHARLLAAKTKLVGVVTSPLVRAVQTAEILAEACRLDTVQVRAELAFEKASARAIEEVARAAGPGWALVGHNPSLAEALAFVLGLSGEPRFRKGAAAALVPGKAFARPWTLTWVAAPGRKIKTTLDSPG